MGDAGPPSAPARPKEAATAVHVLDPGDNVGIACRRIEAGETVIAAGAALSIRATVPLGHKVALRPIAQ